MALGVGTRLGAYEITGTLGAGGMGEVYRATDAELKRDVAVKVLPESLADNAERLARFRREAELLAALNHPNIAQIYGLERSGGPTALVMELIDGPTLADRIAEGPIPVDEALEIAGQLADALEAAHGQGIVHRDLKPANIKLRSDGLVKVLDFGIAKALVERARTTGPRPPPLTRTSMTRAGIVLGTAAYMSPEQARGKPVDQRADIWGFGCILFEMLTGQPAFAGEDDTSTLAKVLERETDMTALPRAVAPAVRQVIELCLEKDPRKRLADVRDVRLGLEGSFEKGAHGIAADGAVARLPWRRALPLVAATVLLTGVVATLVGWTLWPAVQPRLVARFYYDLPKGQTLRNVGRSVMALSPDGRRFVYNTWRGLYLRSMGDLKARLIPGTESSLTNPFFSPDGQAVAYWAPSTSTAGQLKRIALSGGAAVAIADGGSASFGASWGSDGAILYGRPEGIFRVSANGGKPKLLIRAKEGETLYGPELLPDRDSVLFSTKTATENWDQAQIVAQSLSTGRRTVLVRGGSDAHYVAGRLIYARGDGLFGVAFDPKSLRLSGAAVPLVQGVMRASDNITAAANYAVSKTGTLVYVSGTQAAAARQLVWVDSEGHETPVSTPPRAYDQVVLSPDGTHAALGIEGDKSVWIADLERGTLERLPANLDEEPSILFFSADGRRVASSAIRDGRQAVVWQAVDGTGAARPLVTFDASVRRVQAAALSPDGKRFVPTVLRGTLDLGVVTVGDPTSYQDLLATPAHEYGAAISPDGHWIAYSSTSGTRTFQVYVQRFPEGGGRLAVSIKGGGDPHWSADGSALTYVQFDGVTPVALMRVAVTGLEGAHGSPTLGTPTQLFPYKYSFVADGRSHFGVAADGKRFLMINAGPQGDQAARLVLVQNWLQELKRLVPAK